jgi:hypothetical protein
MLSWQGRENDGKENDEHYGQNYHRQNNSDPKGLQIVSEPFLRWPKISHSLFCSLGNRFVRVHWENESCVFHKPAIYSSPPFAPFSGTNDPKHDQPKEEESDYQPGGYIILQRHVLMMNEPAILSRLRSPKNEHARVASGPAYGPCCTFHVLSTVQYAPRTKSPTFSSGVRLLRW